MKLHLLALFLLVALPMTGVLERLQTDANATAPLPTKSTADTAARLAPQAQPSPPPALPPSSQR